MKFETAFQCKAPCKNSALSLSTAALVAAGLIASASPAAAQSSTTPVPRVEMITWDLPTQMDSQPGAVMVDISGSSNRLWFVTRRQEPVAPRVYRMDLGSGKKVNKAVWTSWSLEPNTGLGNGVRRIKSSGDKRYVFVHTQVALQRVDTQNCTYSVELAGVGCPRTIWLHAATTPTDPHAVNPDHGSDIAIDDYNNVYSAIAAGLPGESFIQRLNPNVYTNNVTRWYVGGSVGQCPSTLDTTPCLSGVATDRRSRDLVYYSEPAGGAGEGAIGELNTRTNAVRRWLFSDLAVKTGDATVREPRQLVFDNDGILWAVTGSGHLVSLDPRKSRMSKHRMPNSASIDKDPFGVAPDGGLIGYTDADFFQPRVGMLMPDRQVVSVQARPATEMPKTFSIDGLTTPADRITRDTTPIVRRVPGQIVRNEDGTWSEALTFGQANMPLGITPDETASQGTFLFAVGDITDPVINRIARVRLPKAGMRGHHDRDDDDADDDGKRADKDDDVDDDGVPNASDSDSDNDGTVDAMDDDDDEDGIEDSFDTKDHKEDKQTSQQDAAPGASVETPFTLGANTLLVVASAVAPDPLAPVRVEIVDAAGMVIASSLTTPGAATITFAPPTAGGNYTMRVKNQGLATASMSTTLLTRQLWPVLF